MAKGFVNKGSHLPRAPKPADPGKAVLAAPRLKPTTTREYGKGGTPMSQYPNTSAWGASVGYGGPRGSS